MARPAEWLNCVYLDVVPADGAPSFAIMRDMCKLATQLGIGVRSRILGKPYVVYPGDDPHEQYTEQNVGGYADVVRG